MDGLDTLAQALGITDKKDADWHTLAKVSAVNQDGTLTVYMGGSLNPTTVEAYCSAQAGDVVCVLISKGKARAIARRGGTIAPAVLYYDEAGNNGNVTLTQSAANFKHMRVYFFVKRDSDIDYASTDIYEPNEKAVSLFAVRCANRDGRFHYAGATYYIDGVELQMGSQGVADSGGSFSGSSNTYIYRVEAWN